MNITTPIIAVQPNGVSALDSADDMERFRDEGCAAAVWERSVPPHVASWLDTIDAKTLPNGRVIAAPHAIKAAANRLCDSVSMQRCPSRDWLIEDIATLAEYFAAAMRADFLRLRLQAVTTNACRKFHRDALTGRLVCTYRGTGTQYGTSQDDEDPRHIFTVPTGSPILLRGSLWPPMPSRGLVHRSPPIEGTGETRLVLVLDPVSQPNEDQ